MNRLELLSLALVIAIGAILVIKSKRFDNFIDWLTKGSKSTTVADLKKDTNNLDENKETLRKNIDKQEAEARKARADLEKL